MWFFFPTSSNYCELSGRCEQFEFHRILSQDQAPWFRGGEHNKDNLWLSRERPGRRGGSKSMCAGCLWHFWEITLDSKWLKVSKVIRKTFNFKASKRHTGLACFLGKENVLSSQQHSFSKGEHISKVNLREVLSITRWQEGDLEAERRWSETGTWFREAGVDLRKW